MLDLEADISNLRGAEYNPRFIGEADLVALAKSISELGLVKPLIVRGDLLVAGHQRTKALRRLGVNTAAVFRLDRETTVYDEVRFNQLHNGTDLDCGDENAYIEGGFTTPGWHIVPPERVHCNFRGQLAAVRAEIASMVQKYGPWGGVVASMDGKIIHVAQYAIACRLTGQPLTVHVLPDDKLALARDLLNRVYGVFSYDHLQRATYIQTLAQMNRLRDGPSGKQNNSTLYETMAAPYAKTHPKLRWIDFGAGHGDYAAAMRGRGVDLHDVELFRRDRQLGLDERAVMRMISKMCSDLTEHGPYDATVLDSVMNSVDCLEAEAAVLTICNMLTKKGGTYFVSGRPLEVVAERSKSTRKAAEQRGIEFLDHNGFTALMRSGKWFYQKYHSKEQIPGLLYRFGFQVEKHKHGGSSWQVQARKIRDLPAEDIRKAIDYEFNLPFGPDKTINRHHDVRAAYEAAYKETLENADESLV